MRQHKKWILCGGSYMYSNRHHLNASSSTPDTHTRKNKNARTKKTQSVRKGWSLYAAKKKRVCEADHTSIQIGIAWTPLQLLVYFCFFYFKTARDVVTVLLIFAKYLSLYLHIFTCTYRGTHTQTHMYNQHTRGMATTRHRSLVERGGRKAV